MSVEIIKRLQAKVEQLKQKVSQLEKEIAKVTNPLVILLKPPPVAYTVRSLENGDNHRRDSIEKTQVWSSTS